MEKEDELEAHYPGGDAHHVARKAEVSGISAIAEPEEQDTEMEGVEDGSKVEVSVGPADAIHYSLCIG